MILPYVIKMLDAILPILDDLVESLLPVFVELLEALMPILEPILEIMTMLLVELLVPMLKWIIDKGLKPVIALVTSFAKLIEEVTPKIKEWIMGVVDTVKALWETFTNMFSGVKEAMGGFISSAQEKFGEMSTNLNIMFDNLKVKIVDTWNNIKESAASSMEDMKSRFEPLLEKGREVLGKLKEIYVQTWKDIVDFVKNAIQTLLTFYANLWDGIKEGIQNLKEKFISSIKDFVQIGKDILQGIIQGMIDAVGGIGKWIKQICGDIVDGFKDFFGIKSPSTLAAAEIGVPIHDGILKPIEKIGEGIKKTLSHQIGDIKNTFYEAGKQSVEALNQGLGSVVVGTKKTVQELVNTLQKVPDLSFISNVLDPKEMVIAHETDGVITKKQENKLHIYAHVSPEFEEDLQKLSGAIESSNQDKDDDQFKKNLLYYLQQIQYSMEHHATEFKTFIKKLFEEKLKTYFDDLVKAMNAIYEKEKLKFNDIISRLDTVISQWKASFTNLMDRIDKFWKELSEFLEDSFSQLFQAVADAAQTIGDYVEDAAETISNAIYEIGAKIIQYLSKITQLLERLLDNIKMTFKLLQQLRNEMLGGSKEGVALPEDGSIIPPPEFGMPVILPGDPRYGDGATPNSTIINQNKYVNSEYNIVKQNSLFSHPGDLALMGYKL